MPYTSLILAAVIAAAVVLISGPFLIPKLHQLKFGQSIREEGPKSHKVKQGTPSMGGVMIIAAIAVTMIVVIIISLQKLEKKNNNLLKI